MVQDRDDGTTDVSKVAGSVVLVLVKRGFYISELEPLSVSNVILYVLRSFTGDPKLGEPDEFRTPEVFSFNDTSTLRR